MSCGSLVSTGLSCWGSQHRLASKFKGSSSRARWAVCGMWRGQRSSLDFLCRRRPFFFPLHTHQLTGHGLYRSRREGPEESTFLGLSNEYRRQGRQAGLKASSSLWKPWGSSPVPDQTQTRSGGGPSTLIFYISAPRRQRWDLCELETSLVYIVRSQPGVPSEILSCLK